MSALAWLFGFGVLATSFPLLFHLLRPAPKGDVSFSSLMFLRPSPPRLTKRSRLENLLLLALRMGVVTLLAAAFMRPFFRNDANLGLAESPGRRIAVLVDTSASMHRPGYWDAAIQRAEAVFRDAHVKDEAALFTFDSKLEQRTSFEQPGVFDRRVLKELAPGWQRSDLGAALAALADLLDGQAVGSDDQTRGPTPRLQIIVVSDMQAGSSITALQGFQWPPAVAVDFQRVGQQKADNAALQLLSADQSDPTASRDLVLVRNSQDSEVDQFLVKWSNEPTGSSTSAAEAPQSNSSNVARSVETPFYVPPGSSKVLRVPRDAQTAAAEILTLRGDATTFDNHYYATPPNQQLVSAIYLGDDRPDDADGMLYYLEGCLVETPRRSVQLEQFTMQRELTLPAAGDPDLLILTRSASAAEQKVIDALFQQGASLWIVLESESVFDSTRQWNRAVDFVSRESSSDGYVMLGEIDFAHSIFQPFARPRLNDFTQIRFWRHGQAVLSDDAQVLARFDHGSPAFWQWQPAEADGQAFVLAAGWQPDASQLALSSKFLPIVDRIVDLAARIPEFEADALVGQTVELPADYDRGVVRRGSATEAIRITAPEPQPFNQPGVFEFTQSGDVSAPPIRIAVNLSPAESQIETMPLTQLAALDVRIGQHEDAAAATERTRRLQDIELESRQKLWRWLIVFAIALVFVETWLAGRIDRSDQAGREHLVGAAS